MLRILQAIESTDAHGLAAVLRQAISTADLDGDDALGLHSVADAIESAEPTVAGIHCDHICKPDPGDVTIDATDAEIVAARAVAARCFRSARDAAVARGNGAATGTALAARFGVTHSAIDRLADPASGHALTLGDLLAMPRDLAADVLIAALAHLDEGADVSARDTLDSITIDLGVALDDLRRDLRDKREDEHATHGAAFRKLASTALRGAAACARRAAGGAR